MGDMADYYGEREEEYDFRIDQHIIRTGSYPRHTPKDQRVRSSKGTPVALTPKQKVRKLESELDANLTLQATLLKEEQKLRADIRKADIPNQPPREVGDWFKVTVQFTARGPHYTYLMTRNANRWYTTGVAEDQKRFDSWSALAGWLNTTYWHSDLQLLAEAGKSFPTEHHAEPPF